MAGQVSVLRLCSLNVNKVFEYFLVMHSLCMYI